MKWHNPAACDSASRPGVTALAAAVAFVALLMPLSTAAAGGLDAATEIEPFVSEMAKRHDLDEARIRSALAQARVLDNVLELMSRPAEGKPWHAYRKIFLNERRIKDGVAFWKANRDTLERARERFGVPERIMVAIIGVETLYGTRAGNIRVLDALATLGFRYPKRAAFFRRELGHYLALGEEEGLDVVGVKGSYAGAMGIPQFIPSSYREYSVDFDGDGRRDLIASVEDAIGSVGAYLGRHGWKRGEPVTAPAAVPAAAAQGTAVPAIVAKGIKPHTTLASLAAAGATPTAPLSHDGPVALLELDGADGKEYWLGFDNFYAITRYNHSQLYAMAVHQLSEAIAARLAGP